MDVSAQERVMRFASIRTTGETALKKDPYASCQRIDGLCSINSTFER